MNFPPEVLLEVFRNSGKTELKSARLVCKEWSWCAAEYLFAKLFVSPHKINLETFQLVSQHPILQKCVRHLEYDGVRFSSDLGLSAYIDLIIREPLAALETPSDGDDLEVKEFFSMAHNLIDDDGFISDEGLTPEEEERCKGFEFIQRGFRHYKSQAEFESECLNGRDFSTILCDGIKQLPVLNAISINGVWEFTRKARKAKGSPLARSWSSFQALPHVRVGQLYECKEYSILTTAICTSQKHIRSFKTRQPIASLAFDTRSPYSRLHLDHCYQAYSGLQALVLSLRALWKETWFPGRFEKLDLLRGMLERMCGLKHLALKLHYTIETVDTGIFEDIFPNLVIWPCLTHFELYGMAISTRKLMELIVLQMPYLQHLRLARICLLDGHWEGVFEFLRCANLLRSLDVGGSHTLWQPDKCFNPGENGHDLMDSIEKYVLDWPQNPAMRHPSLPPHSQKHHSVHFLMDVLLLCNKTKPGVDKTLITQMRARIGDFFRRGGGLPVVGNRSLT